LGGASAVAKGGAPARPLGRFAARIAPERWGEAAQSSLASLVGELSFPALSEPLPLELPWPWELWVGRPIVSERKGGAMGWRRCYLSPWDELPCEVFSLADAK
jgi:hypothetical protein